MLPVHILLSVLLPGLFLWFFRNITADRSGLNKFFWPAVILKVLAGLAVGLYYNGISDTFEYQKAANRMTALAFTDFPAYLKVILRNDLSVFPDGGVFPFKTFTNSFFLSKLLSVLNFTTGGNYYCNTIFFSVFSFTGCWYLVRTFSKVFPGSGYAAVFAFLLFPSVVFWSSGIQKEALMLGALGLFWSALLHLVFLPDGKTRQFAVLILSGWLLWKVRFFVAAVVFLLSVSWVALRWLHARFAFFRKYRFLLALIPVLSFLLVLMLIRITGVFDLDYLFHHLVWSYDALLVLSLEKPHIEFSEFEPTLFSTLTNTPEAVFSSFFRPFLFESNSPLYLLAGLENLFLTVLFLGAVFSGFKYGFKKPHQFYVLLVFYILFCAAILALPTPNLGTLNRYRIAFLPFTIFLLMQTPFWQKITDRLPSGFRLK